jgi:hypothetical protein
VTVSYGCQRVARMLAGKIKVSEHGGFIQPTSIIRSAMAWTNSCAVFYLRRRRALLRSLDSRRGRASGPPSQFRSRILRDRASTSIDDTTPNSSPHRRILAINSAVIPLRPLLPSRGTRSRRPSRAHTVHLPPTCPSSTSRTYARICRTPPRPDSD